MKTRHAFALVEAAALCLVTAVVGAALLVFASETRRAGRLGEDIGKLQRIGSLTQQYAADNADMFWTFSWRKGDSLSQWPDLNNAPDDGRAAANQLADILRRRAGRPEMIFTAPFIAQVNYSHVPLLDYAQRVPDETFISAADFHRLRWARDPLGFDQGHYQPAPSGVPGDPNAKRWPYSAGFTISTAFYDKSPQGHRVYQASFHSGYAVPGTARLGAKLVTEVSFPFQKVFVSDSNARHFGSKQPYPTHDQARLPLLFADGSVFVKPSAECNPGWIPNAPDLPGPYTYWYTPAAWEPGTFSGEPAELVTGRFRWTRGFLEGRDFGGPEACTGQPGCP